MNAEKQFTISEAGLGREAADALTLHPEETVLLIIDLQERLMAAMKDKEKVYKNTKILLETAKQLNIPVVVTEQYPRGLGRTDVDISRSLPEHYLLEKMSFSACNPEFMQNLADYKRNTVLVVGSETHVCVYQTARDLILAGYWVQIVKDAVCSRFDDNHDNGLDLMKTAGAMITNTESVVFDLFKVAGTPEFKVISALIK